ncbi:MAG: GNAT family N-acetyltransferase [Betaproteobacteria bacterium]
MMVLETERLTLRWLTGEDAPFILTLLNDPGWLQFIGDRGVRTVEDARKYILDGPAAMIARLGFGLYLTERKTDSEPMGMCGLIKRDGLDDVDIGFAFLPQFCGCGYAFEAAVAVLGFGKSKFGLNRIVGITAPDNETSIKLLKKIGMKYERTLQLPKIEGESMLFAWDASGT